MFLVCVCVCVLQLEAEKCEPLAGGDMLGKSLQSAIAKTGVQPTTAGVTVDGTSTVDTAGDGRGCGLVGVV